MGECLHPSRRWQHSKPHHIVQPFGFTRCQIWGWGITQTSTMNKVECTNCPSLWHFPSQYPPLVSSVITGKTVQKQNDSIDSDPQRQEGSNIAWPTIPNSKKQRCSCEAMLLMLIIPLKKMCHIHKRLALNILAAEAVVVLDELQTNTLTVFGITETSSCTNPQKTQTEQLVMLSWYP